MSIQKSYIYKSFRNGVYLGNLPNVTTDFGFTQAINTAGSQIEIRCAISQDVREQQPCLLADENGSTIISAEDGTLFETERAEDIVGDSSERTLISNNNAIQVWEYSKNYPNGKQMFSGRITDWEADFGNTDQEEVIIHVLSDGADLSNYLIRTGASAVISQSTDTGTYAIVDGGYPNPKNFDDVIQTFTISSATKIGSVDLKLSCTVAGRMASVAIYQMLGSSPNPFLGDPIVSGLTGISSALTTSAAVYTIGLSVPTTLSPGNYYIRISLPGFVSGAISVYDSNTNPYAGGQEYLVSGNSSGVTITSVPSNDIYFVLYGQSNTTSSFAGIDPTTMFTRIIDNYVSQGGLVNYSSSSTKLTGQSVSYTFIAALTLEGVQKALELSPQGWYWYVDLGSDVVFFQQTNSVADLVLVFGRDLTSIHMKASIEQVINDYFFTGGLVGSTNLFTEYTNSNSISTWGRKLGRNTDNRVTLQATADSLGNALITSSKDEQYLTQVTVFDDVIDITTLKPGMTVGFAGFGNFIDALLLQIVQVQYSPEQAILTLGTLPKRLNVDVGAINNALNSLNTVNNPTTPS